MYPSNNDANSPTIPSIPHRSNFFINPSSKLEDPNPSFHFPSPYTHYEDDHVLLQHLREIINQQPPSCNDYTVLEAETATNIATDLQNTDDVYRKSIPRKRSSKKDRHSKINTAHGPRDRRMRLSLDVARKFFGLQDMLGFDKASKTVDWLMTKSKSAIKELIRGFPQTKPSCSVGANSPSSTSECEVLSGIDEPVFLTSVAVDTTIEPPSVTKEKKVRKYRKAAFIPVARESREKARARARERTEKRKLVETKTDTKIPTETTLHDLTRLGSWSPFENESGTQNPKGNPSYGVEESPISSHQPRQQLAEREVAYDPLLISGNWSPSTFFSYQHNPAISQEHQFEDFNVYAKPWEVYNN